jgi:PleD family two-component response regulator
VAEKQPEHNAYKAIFADADQALYLAKESGRNCVCYAEQGAAKLFVDKPLK